jgi:pyrimidine deaminase RibD-like protein/very-short-patch-repair endonuclease
MRNIKSRLTPLAKTLCKAGNVAEDKLWLALRNRNLNGIKFSRQVPIGSYIADFASRELKLVIELDGSQHIDNPKDATRNAYMSTNGWSVARFPSGHMLSAPEGILETIAAICEDRIKDHIVDHDFQFHPAKPVTSSNEAAPHPAFGHPLPVSGERGFMEQALRLGLSQMGRTWPNPAVGCVIIKDGVVIAEGATGDGGRPHAEEVALDKAGAAARGAVAYVTLEPCGQRSNGGCSCSQRLLEAGVARVVYACDDPSSFASHVGVERMVAAGITVENGLLADEADKLIAPTAHYHRTGRPLVQTDAEGQGFDAEFLPESDDLEAELVAWAGRGYRHLSIEAGSELAEALRASGLMTG